MPDHLALPLTVNASGRLSVLEQDSSSDVAQSIAVLLSTRHGERMSVLSYGTPPLLGESFTLNGLAAAIDAWEPRAAEATMTLSEASGPAQPTVTVTLTDGTSITARAA